MWRHHHLRLLQVIPFSSPTVLHHYFLLTLRLTLSLAPSRTCRLCNTKLHPLTQCPQVKTPNINHIRQTLADARANMGSGSSFIQDKLFIDELARILRQIEERDAARSQAIVIDSD